MASVFEKTITDLLAGVDVQINGKRLWDLQVHNTDLYERVVKYGSLGFGEAYMDGWWDSEQLDQLIYRILQADLEAQLRAHMTPALALRAVKLFLAPAGRLRSAFEVGEQHYDLGNDLFEAMLDKRLVYTCAYWKDATTLDEAQEAKLELVCQKIGLKPGMRVLDIGGGWGSFAKYAAEKHGAQVVSVSVSKEQVALANTLCAGLPVENRLQDYRDLNEQFDAIVSLGMFEHVGPKYYSTYMDVVERCLKDDGLFLLHTIGANTSQSNSEPWITKYIFPNSALPAPSQLAAAVEHHFVLEDWHNFGPYYDKTLLAWHENFEKAWPRLKDNYSERFYRMWRFYLLSCAGAFRARNIQLWQLVLSKHGVPGGYKSVR